MPVARRARTLECSPASIPTATRSLAAIPPIHASVSSRGLESSVRAGPSRWTIGSHRRLDRGRARTPPSRRSTEHRRREPGERSGEVARKRSFGSSVSEVPATILSLQDRAYDSLLTRASSHATRHRNPIAAWSGPHLLNPARGSIRANSVFPDVTMWFEATFVEHRKRILAEPRLRSQSIYSL